MIYEERWFQVEAVNSVFEYLENNPIGNPVLALPTGTGKSFCLAMIVKKVLEEWSDRRVIMLTHVRTLISQNAEKLLDIWPTAPLGIHSAGLNERSVVQPILYAGVQSVYSYMKKSEKEETSIPPQYRHFGWRDLVLIDEAHMLSPEDETMYQYVLGKLKEINPYLRVIGLTATPYRMKNGLITDGGIFTDICYNLTDMNSFNRLIEEGYLCRLLPRPTDTIIDVSQVKLVGGEFNYKQVEEIVDKVTYAAVQETIAYGEGRNCWMAFASGIDNSENIAAMFQSFGVDALAVHSKLKPEVNAERMEAHKAGELKCIVSNNMITTGYDCPQVDLIAMLRPTMSVPYHVQMAGRGTRVHPSKSDTLFLDFAKNVLRLGPINDPLIPKKSVKGKGGAAPVWICPSCGFYNHSSARLCDICGEKHVFAQKLFASAGTEDVIRSGEPEIKTFPVKTVMYNKHVKPGSPPMIRVDYMCGLRMYTEFIGFEHSKFIRNKAEQWWMERHEDDPPLTTDAALKKLSGLRMPRYLTVHVNKKPYPEILSVEWD